MSKKETQEARKREAAAFTPKLEAAAEEFRSLYGESWQIELSRFHMGRPSWKGEHLIAEMRQIRNKVTPDPERISELLSHLLVT